MSDETSTTDAATADDGVTQPEAKPEVDWKSKAREWEKRAKANADAAAKLAELEESQKSEAQRLAEARDAAEQRASEAERANIRYRVAVEKGLPASLVDRLRGDTEDDIRADADELLGLVSKPTSPKPDPSQGARGGDSSPDTAHQFASAIGPMFTT